MNEEDGVVGCGVDVDEKCFFTFNGRRLDIAFDVSNRKPCPLVSSFSRRGSNTVITTNFGSHPFLYSPNNTSKN